MRTKWHLVIWTMKWISRSKKMTSVLHDNKASIEKYWLNFNVTSLDGKIKSYVNVKEIKLSKEHLRVGSNERKIESKSTWRTGEEQREILVSKDGWYNPNLLKVLTTHSGFLLLWNQLEFNTTMVTIHLLAIATCCLIKKQSSGLEDVLRC